MRGKAAWLHFNYLLDLMIRQILSLLFEDEPYSVPPQLEVRGLVWQFLLWHFMVLNRDGCCSGATPYHLLSLLSSHYHPHLKL